MKSIDVISSRIGALGITQQKAAELCGMSRQRMWDIMKKRNPKFRSVSTIADGLGLQIQISGMDGREIGFDQMKFLASCEEQNVLYDSLVEILEKAGIRMELVPW